MKYVSIDIETSSLQPCLSHILGISLVVEDTNDPKPLKELPHFTCLVRPHEISGQPYALWMNSWIIEALAGKREAKYPIFDTYEAITGTEKFVQEHFGNKKAVAAGKNVAGFDMQFFPEDFRSLFIHRTLDPGTLCVDWLNDKIPPSLDDIKKRLNIPGDVTHDMYEDALDIIQVFRKFYNTPTLYLGTNNTVTGETK